VLMNVTEKLELVQWARDTVAPFVRANGSFYAAGLNGPTHWELHTHELSLNYAEHALLSPAHRSLA
jgi:hypothetical protein